MAADGPDMPPTRLSYLAYGALLGIVLSGSGCASLWSSAKTASTPLTIVSAGLLAQQAGSPELGLTLANTGQRTLWINVHFQTPGGASDCVLGKELTAGNRHLFLCPQDALRPDTDYPIEITAYDDLAEQHAVSQLNTSLRFTDADIQAAGSG